MPGRRLEALLQYVSAEDRVCPLPTAWDRLHRLLGPGSPRPLILAAWGSPEWAKARRLKEQIHFAAELGAFARVDRFLRRLPQDEWEIVPIDEREAEPLLLKLLAAEDTPRPTPRARVSRQLTLF